MNKDIWAQCVAFTDMNVGLAIGVKACEEGRRKDGLSVFKDEETSVLRKTMPAA